MKNDNNDFEKQREIDAFLEQFNNNEDENLTEYNKNIKNDVNNRFDKISDEFGKSVNHGNDYEPEYSKRKESEEDLWKELDEPGQWNEQPEKKSSHRRKPNKQITSMKSKTNNKKHNIKTGKKHNTKKKNNTQNFACRFLGLCTGRLHSLGCSYNNRTGNKRKKHI